MLAIGSEESTAHMQLGRLSTGVCLNPAYHDRTIEMAIISVSTIGVFKIDE